MNATEKLKAYLLKGDLLDRLMRVADEWDNLRVVSSKTKAPRLTKGRMGTILEVPSIGTADDTGEHPFKVIDASTGGTLKVRVLPGIVNGSFVTVGGSANDQVSAADHAENAPRLTITGTGWIVVRCSGRMSNAPYPTSTDVQFVSTVDIALDAPIAKVTVTDGVISDIYQVRFDALVLVALQVGADGDIHYVSGP